MNKFLLLRGKAALSRLSSTIYIVLFFFKNENLGFNPQYIPIIDTFIIIGFSYSMNIILLVRGKAALPRLSSTIYIVLFFFKNENLDFNPHD